MPKSDVFIISLPLTHNQKLCHISIRRTIGHITPPTRYTPGQIRPSAARVSGLGIPSSAQALPTRSPWRCNDPLSRLSLRSPRASPGQALVTQAGAARAEARPPSPIPGPGSALSVLFITRTKREGLKTARSEPLPHIRFQVCDQEY